MRMTEMPVQNLASAFYSAIHKDFLGIEYQQADYAQSTAQGGKISNFADLPKITKYRRPYEQEVEVVGMFSQTWGSTALGFGGMGGSAMTSAYTIILRCGNEYAVYFSGRLAYRITNPKVFFFEDIKSRNMHKVTGALERYAGDSTDGVVHEGPDI